MQHTSPVIRITFILWYTVFVQQPEAVRRFVLFSAIAGRFVSNPCAFHATYKSRAKMIGIVLILTIWCSAATPINKYELCTRPLYYCSLIRAQGTTDNLRKTLHPQKWQDDLECYAWYLNNMMWSSDICFLFLFERTQRPAFEGAHGERKWSSEE